MNLLRILVLVLLAAALPFRGAVAASNACAEAQGADLALRAEVGPQQAHAAASHHLVHDTAHDMAHDLANGAGHEAAHAATHDLSHPVSHAGGHDARTCQSCAGACCLSVLSWQPPALPQPVAVATLSFPPLRARAAAFQSDGPERPPRSI